MAKREVLGLMECPCCDHKAAEIKAQKCGVKLYLFCPECNAQVFARTPAQEAKMRRAVTVKEPEKAPEPQQDNHGEKGAKPEPARAPVPGPEPKKAAPASNLGAALGFLTGRKG